MKIETQERIKRLEGAAARLLASEESPDVKTEVGLQIRIYHVALTQIASMHRHTPDMAGVVAQIDEFCTLTEQSFATAQGR